MILYSRSIRKGRSEVRRPLRYGQGLRFRGLLLRAEKEQVQLQGGIRGYEPYRQMRTR